MELLAREMEKRRKAAKEDFEISITIQSLRAAATSVAALFATSRPSITTAPPLSSEPFGEKVRDSTKNKTHKI